MRKIRIITYALIGIYFSFLVCASFASDVSRDQIIHLATIEFNKNVPAEYKSEYFLDVVERLQTIYYLEWQRKINSVPIYGDKFIVRMYPDSGEVVNTEFHYSISASQFDTSYSLTPDQAKWLAEKFYSKVTKSPELIIQDKQLLYKLNLDNGIVLGIDAKTGESKILATPQNTIQFSIVDTKFDPLVYYMEVYVPYLLLLSIVVVGGIFYFWRHPFATKGK